MRIETHQNADEVILCCPLEERLNNGLMSNMDTIKHAKRYRRVSVQCGYVIQMIESFHVSPLREHALYQISLIRLAPVGEVPPSPSPSCWYY